MIWEVFQSCGCPARLNSQQRGKFLYIFGSLRIRLLFPKASRHQKISNLQTFSDKSPFCVRGDVPSSILNLIQVKDPTCAKVGRFLSPVMFPVKDSMFTNMTPSALDILFVQKGLWQKAKTGKKRCNWKNYWGKLREEEDIEKSRYFCTFLPMRYALLTGCRFLELLGWERPSLTSLTILQGPWQPHSWLQVEPAWGHAGY